MKREVNDAVHKIEQKVENGVPTVNRVKIKTTTALKATPKTAKIITDVTSRLERSKICKKARKGAHKPLADFKKQISDDVRKDLGMD